MLGKFSKLLVVFLLILPLAMAHGAEKSGKSDKSDKVKKTPLEQFCRDAYSSIGYYDTIEGRLQAVCATELLSTTASERFRDVVRDTTVFPVCSARDALAEGLLVSLSDFLGSALNLAMQESTEKTQEALNVVLSEIETQLNLVLQEFEIGTNTSLSGLTTDINLVFDHVESGIDRADLELNRVDDSIKNGLFAARDKVSDLIKSLDDPSFMPDFVDEGAVNSALFIDVSGIPNLNLTDVNLNNVEVQPLSIDGITIDPVDIEVSEITIPEDPLEALLNLVNMCSYPDQYADLLLLMFGFEEAVDLASGSMGLPEYMPNYNDAVQECSIRGGHICSEQELDVTGIAPQPGQWAGGYGLDSNVVWMPGTRAYASPYPPIEANAGNLFTFPRQVPVKIHPPVYPNGEFHCCSVSPLKINKRGKLSFDKKF